MAREKLPISVVIPTKNEERNLPGCLDRLSEFETVIIVDSGSTDATVAIAASYGHEVLEFDWGGGFPKKRNWVLLNHRFETPWVLFLDADELVTPEFVAEAREALALTVHAGFWLNYRTHFMGKVLSYGVAQRKLALIRVGAGLYERIEDPGWSHLDMEVHEHPQLGGSTGAISAQIDHLDFRGVEHFIARHNAYANWETRRYLSLSATPEGRSALTARQKWKYHLLERWWFAPMYFFGTYLLKLGFLDGIAGLDYALLKMNYFHQIRLQIAERRAAGP
ncbi:glycosyltransferase family 2 protein [Phenylobacterium sp.]|uniref:glycosyltransferase family 2 protein n=1 Tax=Phenylobacterium sp. TaxID=1871053 RepID=UPI00271D60D7|nr:glycosyltransferase family 2 protein [Phenylobacterium sp.]MDO8801625.1 glycosyltransferase family 2 protein [Phenylobacterium sp.]